MPRKAKPPRLHLRPARFDRDAVWVILDRGREISTGSSEGDAEGAEKALSTYLARKYNAPKPGAELAAIPVATVLKIYLEEHVPTVASPSFITGCVAPLLEWWGGNEKMLSDVRRSSCDLYVKWRTAQPRKHRRSGLVSKSTARHDLTVLAAAITYYHGSDLGPLPAMPVVELPPAKPPREDYWLTRTQVAERIWAARRLKRCKHVIRVILIGVYSGTRPGATRALHWIPSTAGGWFDMDAEVLHRKAMGEEESNKRKPKAKMHRKLIFWCKRWRKADMEDGVVVRVKVGESRIKQRRAVPYVIHYAGRQVKQLRRSWATVAIAAGHGVWVPDEKHKNGGRMECKDGPHICRHTAATWQMHAGTETAEAAGYLGMSEKMYKEVYGHHHPDFQKNAANASGRRAR